MTRTRPTGSWALSMEWHDLLFLHWRIPHAELRQAVPEPLELETFDGSAWIAVVPFRMAAVRPRCLPAVAGLSAFPELNLRTYVRHGGRTGVYFFSLDAHQRFAVRTARLTFGLPYFDAQMSCAIGADQGVSYASKRNHRGAPAAEFRADYRPIGPIERAMPGSLEHFLTERYSLFTVDRRGRPRRGDIWHEPWPLQRAECSLERCDMARLAGVEIPDVEPHMRFARRLAVRAWLPRRSVDVGTP